MRAPIIAAILCAILLEPLLRRQNTEQTPRTVAKWTKRILKLANVELTLEGAIPEGPGLFVSNHRSYIDILVVLAHLPATFLCKKEVRAWPLIGRVAEKMGVVFVDRSSAASRLASLTLVTSAVIGGQRVVAFPEGTTTRGPGMRTTYPGLFREADRQQFSIFPMVIEYADRNDAWVDDDTLLRHVFSWLSKPATRVKLSFGPAVLPQDAIDSQQRAEAWMRTELARLNHYSW
jgi:1-acyl-sn-glycerol-3-phosphate acyltransferase